MRDRFLLNNFDLLRLFAAAQVATIHGIDYLQVDLGPLGTVLSFAPGVPIFFFTSGFLISRSYESNSRLSEYARNRALRLYPALIVCTILVICSLFAAGYFPDAIATVGPVKLSLWVAGQLSVVQFYNPEFMRDFGTGMLNAGLWTITVELQFYALVPVLYRLLSRVASTRARWNAGLAGVTVAFLIASVTIQWLPAGSLDWLEIRLLTLTSAVGYGERLYLASKLIGVTFVPWFYMFLVGVVAQRHFDAFARILAGKAALLIPAYLGAAYLGWRALGSIGRNAMNPALFLLLAATVFSCAYSATWVSGKLLRRHDISYGLYIYHLPVINLLIYFGYTSRPEHLASALLIAVAAAVLSWFFVERAALALKQHPLVGWGLRVG